MRGIVCIATCARQSAWCIGWNEAQRQAIYADARWQGGRYAADEGPEQGLATARMIGMLTYRSAASLERRFGRESQDPTQLPPAYRTYDPARDAYFFAIQSYLRYQGRKLVRRFDANCYVRLTQTMVRRHLIVTVGAAGGARVTPASARKDLFDLATLAGDASTEAALRRIRQPALIIAIESDLLYTADEQRLRPRSAAVTHDPASTRPACHISRRATAAAADRRPARQTPCG